MHWLSYYLERIQVLIHTHREQRLASELENEG
jgi:hypothetical protein